MFEERPEFGKPDRSDEAERATLPARSPWEPLTLMRLIGAAVAIVLVVVLLTRAYLF